MKKPFYYFQGEKCKVTTVSYFADHRISLISVINKDREIDSVFAGESYGSDLPHDKELEENIIWEEV